MEMFMQLLLSLLVLGAIAQGQHALTSQSAVAVSNPRRGTRRSDDVSWNDVIDNLISQFRQQIREQGKDEVPLPDIHETFAKKLLVTVHGKFDASGGHLKSVTSVHRTGDVTLNSTTSPPTLTVTLRFGDLQIHYQHYHARVWSLGPRGRIDATVADSAFRLSVGVNAAEGGCSLDYEGVHMLELSGFKVKVKGLSLFNKLASFIASRITEKMRHSIAASLEKMLNVELRDIFRNAVLDCSPFVSVGMIDIRGGGRDD